MPAPWSRGPHHHLWWAVVTASLAGAALGSVVCALAGRIPWWTCGAVNLLLASLTATCWAIEIARVADRRLGALGSRLEFSQDLARDVVQRTVDAVITVGDDNTVMFVNQQCRDLLGDVAPGTPITSIVHVPHSRTMEEILAGEANRVEGAISGPTGTTRPALLSSSAAAGIPGRILVWAHDLTDHRRLEEALAWQVDHDTLTGLPNRAAATAAIERALRIARRRHHDVAVLVCDLYGFTSVNERHGPGAGDALLVEAAHRIQGSARTDCVVARLGGDEFVVVMEQIDRLADAVNLGERLISELEAPTQLGDLVLHGSASVGVAHAPDGSGTPLGLLRNADAAVTRSKRRSPGRVEVFDATMQTWLEERADTEQALRWALDHHALELHYQPVVGLGAEPVNRVEALLRWNRDGDGFVSPADFIPVAEDSHLIIDLSRWVLVRACRQLEQWANDPLCSSIHIAVNISGRHITRGDLVADVRAALALTGVNPQLLELELTETQMLDDPILAGLVLQELRDLGVMLSIDDFGTGYASVTHLRQLPLTTLKIDQSFVHRMTERTEDRSIVELMVVLGQTLDFEVIAEGVERTDQLELLETMGCRLFQGFLFSKPLPADEFRPWLAARSAAMRSGSGIFCPTPSS